jgi:arylsulfatase A-like enzyme
MASRPNFVFFIPDQLRFDSVGCFGNPLAETPHIDALAHRGTRFTRAYAQHSVCSPSRVSFLTGWYPHVRGHRTLSHLLQAHDPNLLRLLRDNGYTVVHPGLRGDTFAEGVTELSTDRFGFAVRPNMVFMPSPYDRDHKLARAFYHGRRPHSAPALDFDEATVRTAEEWLSEGLPEPWALYVPLIFPHPPFEVEEPWFSQHGRRELPDPQPPLESGGPLYMNAIRERYGTDRLHPDDWREIRATYYGMVSRVDHHLGRVMRAVEEAGCADHTATFFFTDHGEYLGDFGLIEKWPAGQHECLLHNPLVVAAPGGAENRVAESFVELVDLLPTVLELAEIEPTHTHFGRSFAPLLRDAGQRHRDAAYAEGGFALHEARLFETADFPYDLKAAVQHELPASVGKVVSLRTDRWTYCHRLYEPSELYDRLNDPDERSNLVDDPEHADVVAQLRSQLLDWLFSTADVIPWEADPRMDSAGSVKARVEAE